MTNRRADSGSSPRDPTGTADAWRTRGRVRVRVRTRPPSARAERPPGPKGNDHAERPSARPADRGRWPHHDPGLLGPGRSSVRQAREAVRKWLVECGLPDLTDIAELLVGELATNAVVHAGDRYRLTLSLGVGTLRCEVADEHRHLPRPPHRQSESAMLPETDADSENGRGLLLVDALTHR
ncbi:ATP-binding protein [Streptomyces hokutonensis]|uniref:ATP-binding protein n=1 Tax=Streptomyces hokutonensis TaxID=1306990 RepID=UPI00380CD409